MDQGFSLPVVLKGFHFSTNAVPAFSTLDLTLLTRAIHKGSVFFFKYVGFYRADRHWQVQWKTLFDDDDDSHAWA